MVESSGKSWKMEIVLSNETADSDLFPQNETFYENVNSIGVSTLMHYLVNYKEIMNLHSLSD